MRTPLYSRHVALGARMVEFAGWEMPVWYSGTIAEHTAVRQRAGLFDVSHMGEILVTGPGALALVQRLTTNDASTLVHGQVQYAFMCNERGGVIDDCTLYRIRDDCFMLVVNAANIEKDFLWIRLHAEGGALVENVSEEIGLVALQGPRAVEILQSFVSEQLDTLRYYNFIECQAAGILSRISRMGYTGEDGFEIYCSSQDVVRVWDILFEGGGPFGLVPCGLGARDTLRLEAGMALWGSDLDEEHTPLEANLGRFVKFQKPSDFIGKEALILQQKEGARRKLVGFLMDGREIARSHYEIYSTHGELIGAVTSGAPSSTLGRGIGMGYIASEFSQEGTAVHIRIREKKCPAAVVRLPFYKRSKV